MTDYSKLHTFFSNNCVSVIPTIDVPLTNEIAEGSLGRLDSMRKPQFNLTGPLSNLSIKNRAMLQSELKKVWEKILSFVK